MYLLYRGHYLCIYVKRIYYTEDLSMCADGVAARARREGTPIFAQQAHRGASGGRFRRVFLPPRATSPGHVAVAMAVLFAAVDRNLPLRRRRHSQHDESP